MANIKSKGCIFDGNLVILTGDTITAGSLIFVDVSGTNVVRAVRTYSGVTPESNVTFHNSATSVGIVSLDTLVGTGGSFLGVLAGTQTGVAGSQTGVSYYTDGVFQFNVTPTSSANLRVGYPAYAVSHDTVRSAWSGLNTAVLVSGTAATAGLENATGTPPIGIVSFVPQTGLHTTGANSRVYVKIFPHRTMESFA